MHTILPIAVFNTITGDDWKRSFQHARERRRGTHKRIWESAKAHGFPHAPITATLYAVPIEGNDLFDFLNNEGHPLPKVDGPDI